jgi:hypothetical protein
MKLKKKRIWLLGLNLTCRPAAHGPRHLARPRLRPRGLVPSPTPKRDQAEAATRPWQQPNRPELPTAEEPNSGHRGNGGGALVLFCD